METMVLGRLGSSCQIAFIFLVKEAARFSAQSEEGKGVGCLRIEGAM